MMEMMPLEVSESTIRCVLVVVSPDPNQRIENRTVAVIQPMVPTARATGNWRSLSVRFWNATELESESVGMKVMEYAMLSARNAQYVVAIAVKILMMPLMKRSAASVFSALK